jgi:Abnormal spindle-like microcephaly-assoc'd, ASPM-SPD-2-Hydin
MPGRRTLGVSALSSLALFLAFPQQSISFPGQSGQPSVNYPQSLQLSDILVGTSGTFVILMSNQGTANWIIDSITATGDFSTSTTYCQSPIVPTTAPPGSGNDLCQLWITFTPSAVGQRTGTLTITDNVAGSPHVIPLTASGVSFYSSPGIWFVQAIPTDTPNPFLLITGNGFFPDSQINVNGAPRTTLYLSGQGLAAVLTAADLAQSAEVQVTITNPSPGGTSNSAPGVIYQPIRNVTIRHSVFELHSGLLYASADPTSATDPGQVLVINPATGQITNQLSVGNGPNQLAVSDDGAMLYVGLDTDNTVAQVALPAGTVNFAVSLGTNPNPMVAHALGVLPGTSDSWAVVLSCAVINVSPCGGGDAVFDGEVMRPTEVQGDEPDYLLFMEDNAATLFGTTNSSVATGPSIFYEFAINSGGITESQMVQNLQTTSPGGGVLDTDGTSIYVSNGQIIDPNTLAITNTLTGPNDAGIRVDAPNSNVYFAGGPVSFQPAFTNTMIEAFSLSTQQPTGLVYVPEVFPDTPSLPLPEIFRWGSDGLAINAGDAIFLMHTSLTSAAAPPPQPFISSFSPTTVAAGSAALPLTIFGGGLSASDTLTANGEPLTVAVTSGPFIGLSQLSATIPAPLLSVPGEVQLVLTDTSGHAMYEDLIVTPSGAGSSIALSTNNMTFGPQLLASSSTAQTLKISNTGSAAIQVSGVTISGDFSQTNNCTTIAAGASCSVMVTFQPTADGARTGLLTINDSDVSQTQSVALNGTGADVQVAGTGTGGTTASVASGQTATYNLTLTPTAGLAGQAMLSCTNLPTSASCVINPSSVDLSKGAAGVAVMIATSSQQSTAAQEESRRQFGTWMGLPALALLALLGVCLLSRVRRVQRLAVGVCCVLLCVALASCGGGSSGTVAPPPTPPTTPAGNYTVNLVITTPFGTKPVPLTLTVN